MEATYSSETSVFIRPTRRQIPEGGFLLYPYEFKFSLSLFWNYELLRGNIDGLATSSEFLATDPEVRVRFPALPDDLRSSGSGTGSTQPLEYN
jgi:hypothetical protein